ncbi:uncharacterized protein LOC135388112 isoform X1 [Ornithodoros turicata]|uniref:uncharacterized protein LOC135388112 isoform X1 n=1 Tax=Ornithodoros turicata TaxID=34597 RepID=UPI0031398249
MAPGQKRKAISLHTKCDIIMEAQQGAKVVHLSRKHGLPQSTISTILKKGEKFIESACSGSQPGSRKRIREAALKDVEDALFEWFVDMRARDETVSGPILAAEATRLAKELGRGDFQPGGGWIQRFKDRHGIVNWNVVDRDFLKSSYAENKGEYIIPNIPDASAPSTSAALDPSSSLILSDVRSLTDLAEDTQIQIKEEIVEESMEEEEEEHVLVSEVPPSPSSATTSFTIPPFAGPSTSAATAQLLTLSESPLVQVVTNTVPMVVPSAPTDTPPMLPPVGQSTPQLQEPQETPVPMTTSTPEARAGPKSFALTRKRQATPWTPPSIADRKAKVELELLQAKKKKLEAEERKAIAETQRMAEERKKFEEEQKKLRAEADFYLQERIRSAEETKKATAIAEYHFEEKRKASAKADMLIEHKRFYIEQQKTEIIRRKMLMFELRKMKQDLKLVAQ